MSFLVHSPLIPESWFIRKMSKPTGNYLKFVEAQESYAIYVQGVLGNWRCSLSRWTHWSAFGGAETVPELFILGISLNTWLSLNWFLAENYYPIYGSFNILASEILSLTTKFKNILQPLIFLVITKKSETLNCEKFCLYHFCIFRFDYRNVSNAWCSLKM